MIRSHGHGPRTHLLNSFMHHGAHRTYILSGILLLILGTFMLPGREACAQQDTAGASTLRPSVLVADSDGSNFWYLKPVRPLDPEGYRVMHHGYGMDKGRADDAFSMSERPAAMAAVENELYLIFEPLRATSEERADQSDEKERREQRVVTRSRAEYDEAVHLWAYEPRGRMERVASLPGDGRLIDAVANGRVPMVLLGPGTQSKNDSAGGGAGAASFTLLELSAGGWVSIPLPEELNANPHVVVRLLAARQPTLLVSQRGADGGPTRTSVLELESGGWVQRPTTVDATKLESSCLLDGATAASFTGAGDSTSVEIGFLRHGEFLPISTSARRPPLRKLVAVSHQLALAEQKSLNDPVTLTSIDYTTGYINDAVEMQQFIPLRQDDFGLLILVAGLVASLLILAVFRPNPARMKPELPATMALTSPTNRLFALLIDFVPAAALASQILGVSISSTLTPPILFVGWSNSGPALLAISLCLAHCTVTECLWGRTLGKFFTDCRTVTLQGKRPSIVQTLVRNIMKGMALMLPPLAALVFMNPYHQHLGDLVARTVVASDLGRPENDESRDSMDGD